jgi:hypothetical protein
MCRLLEGSNADLVRIFQAERRGNLGEFGSLCLAQMKVKKDHIWGHVCMSGMRKGGSCAPGPKKAWAPTLFMPASGNPLAPRLLGAHAAPVLPPDLPPKGPGPPDVILVDMRKQPNGTSGKKPAAPSVKVRPGHAE